MIKELLVVSKYHNCEYDQGGVQNQIFATKRGRGYRVNAFLNIYDWQQYWELVDMGFKFNNVKIGTSFMWHGVRPRGNMSLIGISIRQSDDVKKEVQMGLDRLNFRLSHELPIREPVTEGKLLQFRQRI